MKGRFGLDRTRLSTLLADAIEHDERQFIPIRGLAIKP